MIRRRKLQQQNKEEWILLSYMIMKKSVLESAFKRFTSKELKINHFTEHFRIIARWTLNYYKLHHKAPKQTIQNIFDRKKKYLGNSAEVVEEYLSRIADEYLEFQEQGIQPDYVSKDILIDFIRRNEINHQIESIQNDLEQDRLDRAEKTIISYKTLSDEDEDEKQNVFVPLTTEDVESYYQYNPRNDEIYRFPGYLDKLIGPLEKKWLVAVTGIEKSGKSYFMQDIAFDAAVYDKRKVLIVNLELSEKQARNRLYRRISRTANHSGVGKNIFPIFDCANNQRSICEVRKRQSNADPLYEGDIRSPENRVTYLQRKNWRVCTKCRDIKQRTNAVPTKRFIPAIWFHKIWLKEVTEKRVKKAIRYNQMMGLKNLRIRCFPRFSATFDEAREAILRYMDQTKFQPDIIMFDYLDILAPETGNLQERTDVDRKWKKAAKLAGELNTLVITADQANKATRGERNLSQMSTTESKTKDGHLDIRIALNRTIREMDLHLTRVTVLFHRHEEFNPGKEVMITQRLSTADSLLDCEYWPHKTADYPVKIN